MIEYSKDVEKDPYKLPKTEVAKILARVNGLSENPRPSGVEPLQGRFKGLYRVRRGNYRIIYQIIDDRLTVLVVKVSHLREVYR